MSIFSDPLNLALIVVAVLAAYKLWQVLGRAEFSSRAETLQVQPHDLELTAVEVPPKAVWEGLAEKGSALALGLEAIAQADPGFDGARFMAAATDAHERILNAFAAGESQKLENLLAKKVYDIFVAEIERRKTAGETAIFKFIRLTEAKLQFAELQGSEAKAGIAFATDVVSAIKNAAGEIISGNDKTISTLNEMWVFERNLARPAEGWRLTETHDNA